MIVNERLSVLPENIQKEVIETLKGWTGCYVYQHEETKDWKVSTGIGITRWHDPWELIESFENYEIFTKEEIEKYSKEYWNGACWY